MVDGAKRGTMARGVLAGAGALLLAACGGHPGSGTATPAAPAAPAAPAGANTPAAPAGTAPVAPISLPVSGSCAGSHPASAADTVLPVRVVPAGPGNALVTAGVCMDGRGPFPFVVDTGAQASVIDPTLAAQLHLGTFDRVDLTSFGCKRSVSFASPQAISLAGIDLQPQVVVVGTIRSPVLPGLMGVIGSDVLSRFGAVRFGYRSGTLTLAGPEGAPLTSSPAAKAVDLDATMRSGTTRSFPAAITVQSASLSDRPGQAVPVVQVEVEVDVAGHRSEFAVDTGALRSYVSPGLASAAGLASAGPSFRGYTGYDCPVSTSQLKVGSWKVHGLALAPATVYSNVLPPGLDGLLGSGTLTAHSPVVVDYRDSALLWGSG